MSSKIKEYSNLISGMWGSGEFGEKSLGKPDPFSVLTDDTRRAIVVLLSLKGPLTVQQIAKELDLAPSTVLDHIKKLKEAMVVREVEYPKKKYKREKYYDVDFIPYFEEEREEIAKRMNKYIDILKETTLATFMKSLEDIKSYVEKCLMAKHGFTLENDEVRHFIWVTFWKNIDKYLYEKKVIKSPLKTAKRHYFYVRLKKLK